MSGFAPPDPAGVLPATQRLIVRYAKRGRMRFASHRDIARAVERGVRRAGLPIAYSAGFTPHPKISYAGAAPTGAASEAEYLELSLTRACAPSGVRERLDAALPDGIDVIEVTEGPVSLGALPLEASQWQAALPGVSPQQAASAVEKFLACAAVEVERLTSKGTRRVDARAAVLTMAVDEAAHPARRLAAASPGPAVSPRGGDPPGPPDVAGDEAAHPARRVAAASPGPAVSARGGDPPGPPDVAGDEAAHPARRLAAASPGPAASARGGDPPGPPDVAGAGGGSVFASPEPV